MIIASEWPMSIQENTGCHPGQHTITPYDLPTMKMNQDSDSLAGSDADNATHSNDFGKLAVKKPTKRAKWSDETSSDLSEPPSSSPIKALRRKTPNQDWKIEEVEDIKAHFSWRQGNSSLANEDSRSSSPSPFTTRGRKRRKSDRDKAGQTKLHKAAARNKLDDATFLLEECYADVNEADNAGWSPLHEAAIKGHAAMAEFLLSHGADVNVKGLDNDTPLLEATENGHTEVVRVLLRHGADPRVENSKGDTPKDMVDSDDEELRTVIDDALRKVKGTKRPGEGQTEQYYRSESMGEIPEVASIRRRAGARAQATRNELLWIDGTSKNAIRQLVHFARNGEVQHLSHLLLSGTPAHIDAIVAAAKYGHTECTELLLGLGGDVNGVDEEGNTPLLAAAGRGHQELISALLRAGADPTVKNSNNESCVDIARLDLATDDEEMQILRDAMKGVVHGEKTPKPFRQNRMKLEDDDRNSLDGRFESQIRPKPHHESNSTTHPCLKRLRRHSCDPLAPNTSDMIAVKKMAIETGKKVKTDKMELHSSAKKSQPLRDAAVNTENGVGVSLLTALNGAGPKKVTFESEFPTVDWASRFSQVYTALITPSTSTGNGQTNSDSNVSTYHPKTLWVFEVQIALLLCHRGKLLRKYPTLSHQKGTFQDKVRAWEVLAPIILEVDRWSSSRTPTNSLDRELARRAKERANFLGHDLYWIKVRMRGLFQD